MPKPYTASTAPVVNAALLGMTEWVRCAAKYSNGSLWDNGTYVKRDIRGKPGQISNHARGLAADLSFRFMPASKRGVTDGRKLSLNFVKQVLANYDVLGVQLVIDYYPAPFGRSWRCDRAVDGLHALPNHAEGWRKAAIATFTGAGGGDWWHVEISQQLANDPAAVRSAFASVFAVSTPAV